MITKNYYTKIKIKVFVLYITCRNSTNKTRLKYWSKIKIELEKYPLL